MHVARRGRPGGAEFPPGGAGCPRSSPPPRIHACHRRWPGADVRHYAGLRLTGRGGPGRAGLRLLVAAISLRIGPFRPAPRRLSPRATFHPPRALGAQSPVKPANGLAAAPGLGEDEEAVSAVKPAKGFEGAVVSVAAAGLAGSARGLVKLAGGDDEDARGGAGERIRRRRIRRVDGESTAFNASVVGARRGGGNGGAGAALGGAAAARALNRSETEMMRRERRTSADAFWKVPAFTGSSSSPSPSASKSSRRC